MDNLSKMRRKYPINKIIFSRYLILLFIVCITVLLIVILNRTLTSVSYPVAWLESNLTDNSATITFVTPRPIKTCLWLYALVPPTLKRDCETEAMLVHRFDIRKLNVNTSYQIRASSGFKWFSQYIDPLGGILSDKAYVAQPIPALKTSAKMGETDTGTQLPLIGQVVDHQKRAQSQAVVAAIDQEQTVLSTKTNEQGGFSLNLPPAWQTQEIRLLIWSEQGFKKYPLPLILTKDKPIRIVIDPYE